MKRATRRVVPFLVLLLAGCSTAPVSFQGVAPPGLETAYRCAVAQLNLMDYTIEDGNLEAGFVRGRRQTSGAVQELFTGAAEHDVLTASVFDNPATGNTHIRVVASRVADHDIGFVSGLDDEEEQGENQLGPSDSGRADAQRLLTNCGVVAVTGQSSPQ
ncbi:hypothetical protein [Candidatus Palauibacter sp.]|uniref:hypothetical protein n=1 Tax=Candidatus Palauibacter sp. TaxID=3101350 RepID=UPI003B01A709